VKHRTLPFDGIPGLVRAHPIAAIIAVLAGSWTAAVLIVDAYHVFEFGASLPPAMLEAVGFISLL